MGMLSSIVIKKTYLTSFKGNGYKTKYQEKKKTFLCYNHMLVIVKQFYLFES